MIIGSKWPEKFEGRQCPSTGTLFDRKKLSSVSRKGDKKIRVSTTMSISSPQRATAATLCVTFIRRKRKSCQTLSHFFLVNHFRPIFFTNLAPQKPHSKNCIKNWRWPYCDESLPIAGGKRRPEFLFRSSFYSRRKSGITLRHSGRELGRKWQPNDKDWVTASHQWWIRFHQMGWENYNYCNANYRFMYCSIEKKKEFHRLSI